MTKYIVASSKKWFFKYPKSDKYKKLSIFNIKDKEKLNLDYLAEINPRYIFFPHWSWKVESEIINKYECVVFHTAPLPYGRGGSPIQNLIIKGFKKAPLSALKMIDELDAGPIYDQSEISLDGSLDEILMRLAIECERMITKICSLKIKPEIEQKGEVFLFKRLTEKDNELDFDSSLKEIYNKIRMVDGEEYKKSYIRLGNYKVEFSSAELNGNKLNARINIIEDN